jgi:hypothetical protein
LKDKPPTDKQIRTLERIGLAVNPVSKAEAQRLIDNQFRPRSKRERQKPRKRQRTRSRRKRDQTFWLTPAVWSKPCSRCPTGRAVAFRFSDQTRVCADCIERLGINAKPSKRWNEGGAKAGSSVSVRFECPVCGGEHSRAEHGKTTGARANPCCMKFPPLTRCTGAGRVPCGDSAWVEAGCICSACRLAQRNRRERREREEKAQREQQQRDRARHRVLA